MNTNQVEKKERNKKDFVDNILFNKVYYRFLQICFFLFSLQILAQNHPPKVIRNYASRHFDIRDGLAQMQVMCAFQDADGYLWFGTKNGVSRFDGNEFVSYKKEEGIPRGEILDITQWGNDIFHFTYSQIAWFSPGYPVTTVDLPSDYVNDIYPTYLISGERVFLFNIRKKTVDANYRNTLYLLEYSRHTKYFRLISIPEKIVYCTDDNMLIGVRNIYSFNPATGKISISGIKLPHPIVESEQESMITKDPCQPVYYFNTEKKITAYRWDKHKRWTLLYEINERSSKMSSRNPITISRKGEMVISATTGLKIYRNGKLANVIDSKPGISNGSLIDRENNLWLYGENGIYCYSQLNFEEYRMGFADSDMVWSINQDNAGNMYFGSYGYGLWKMDKDEQLTEIKSDLPHSNLQYFNSSKSADGILYFPYNSGVVAYKNGKIEKINDGFYTSLCTYADTASNKLYAGQTDVSVNHYLTVRGRQGTKSYRWGKGFIVSMAKDSKERIRVGTFRSEGVFDGDSLYTIPVEKNAPDSGAISLAVDTLGRVWKGRSSGLYYEDLDGKNHRYLKEYIQGNVVAVHLYRNKYLLIGGEKSIFIVDIYNKYRIPNGVREFGYENGFTGIEPGQSGFYTDRNNDVWLTCSACVIKFNPDYLIQSFTTKIPPLRIDALLYSKNNIEWERHTLSFPVSGKPEENIRIESDNEYFRFEYVANSLSSPKSLRFKYRLKGFTDEWSPPVFTKSVEYTNLKFGKYTFEVQCSLDGVRWSPVVASPEIRVLAPFWFRWYMWTLYILSITGIIIGITLYFSKRREKKRVEVLTRQKLENELQFRTLHSKVLPHFTKNVLTAIGHFAMDDNRKAGKYIAMFSKFTQLTLENSDKNYNTLANELNYVQIYLELEKMRFGEKFSCHINIDNIVDKNINIPAMALHTYCDNAIRHGLVNKKGNGVLNISVSKQTKGTIIAITDNGIGCRRSRELGTQGNGMGLDLVRWQLEFYNKMNEQKITQTIIDLFDNDGNATGTQVKLFVPDGYRFINQ